MTTSNSPSAVPCLERSQSRPVDWPQRILVVIGMSGAGKTTVLKALEDMGYDTVDRMPISLLPRLIAPAEEVEATRRPLAIGIDVRTRDFDAGSFIDRVRSLQREDSGEVVVLFLACDDEELRRRYAETRHRHPLAEDRPLKEGIAEERVILGPLRSRADVAIDTTGLAPGELKRLLKHKFGFAKETRMVVAVTSFSFRVGVPREADLVFDVRFLANPYYNLSLRPLSGRDAPVAEYIEADSGFALFFNGLTSFLSPLLPLYANEGKSYLTIAIGCTGGRHRSVFAAERLASWLDERGQPAELYHRDLERSFP